MFRFFFNWRLRIKENLLLACPDATDQEIDNACKTAGADEFINKLPNGIHTKLGKAGNTISVGQKQRISIARAMLKKSTIILLDEATSSLDSETEEKIQKALGRLTLNKTTIVIAHRLSTVKAADQIIFIENGKIEDVGSHDELMLKTNSRYRHFVNLQNN